MDMTGTLFETVEDRSVAQAYAVLMGEITGPGGLRPTTRQTRLLTLVASRSGAARAVAADELCRLLGIHDDRCIRADVKELRDLFGVRIGSSRDTKAGGYYLIASKAELFDTLRPMLNQAKSEIRTARMMCSAHELAEISGQLDLNLNDVLTSPSPKKEHDHAA